MSLHVIDFGCVPDGRFLERVSVDAGSTVLTVAEGFLRPVDVGKLVAVPGAADLVATIASLVDERRVRNASMTAGAVRLTGTLFDPENPDNDLAFRADLHVGMRITISGAGPGGEVLLSSVVAVVDATTIDLADAAAADVSNVDVILNDPGRVGLSNHARRKVENRIVDIGDRTIDDGSMEIGARGLVSASARFSSLDVGKEVTILEAGLFVTAIASFESSTQVTLDAPAPRGAPDVLADVFNTDSRPGLELLLAALGSLEAESAEVRFGPGVFDFTRIPDLSNDMNAAIGLQGLSNLTFRGEGPGVTILRLMPNQQLSGPDTHVIETRDCHNLTFVDLSVHGAYLTMGNTNEQMHGINLNEGSREIVVERVRVFQSAGDGIRFLGAPDNKVSHVWVNNCRLLENKRSGIGFQRAAKFVWVQNSYIEMRPPSTDSCVDFEPTGDSAPTDVLIGFNIIVHQTRGVAVAISGISGDDPTRRVSFVDNIVLGGSIFCTDVDELTIRDNMVLVPEDGPARIPVQVQRGGDSVMITGNLLVSDPAETQALISISEVNQRKVRRSIVAGNLCIGRARNGIQAISSADVTLEGNTVVATGACTNAIVVRSVESEANGVSVRNNDITVEGEGAWETGVRVNARENQPVRNISVVGNSIRGATDGITFQGSDFPEPPVCSMNHLDVAVSNPLIGLDQLPQKTVVAGGTASHGGSDPGSGTGRFLVGVGDPNDNSVIGNAGDIYQRVDAADGPRLFVKESDQEPAAGWIPK
jgi:hypothetical protein